MLAGGLSSSARDYFYDSEGLRKPLVKLNGDWKFSVGDSAQWAQPQFNDKDWAEMRVPSAWREQGYNGYDGYAWYRKSFTFPEDAGQETVLLSLGRVDDVDEVYINGKLVGTSGQFPPDYASASREFRTYEVPAGLLKPGKDNLIAVRVYDGGGNGGIREGTLGLYHSGLPQLAVRLDGLWQFHPGDDPRWKEARCDDTNFVRIQVPEYWDNQGYDDLDGFAWYRTTFAKSNALSETTAVLLLGRVDDMDEVYLNGTFIGSTGNMKNADDDRRRHGWFFTQWRAYSFPTALLQETNTLAVRVYDFGSRGGICAGPVGIMAQSDFARFWRLKSQENKSWLRRIFNDEGGMSGCKGQPMRVPRCGQRKIVTSRPRCEPSG